MSLRTICVKTRLLRVTGHKLCAGAVWKKTKRGWRADPNACAPILRWVVGKHPAYVAHGLMRRGLRWEWLNI